jgi:hypothetical protein
MRIGRALWKRFGLWIPGEKCNDAEAGGTQSVVTIRGMSENLARAFNLSQSLSRNSTIRSTFPCFTLITPSTSSETAQRLLEGLETRLKHMLPSLQTVPVPCHLRLLRREQRNLLVRQAGDDPRAQHIPAQGIDQVSLHDLLADAVDKVLNKSVFVSHAVQTLASRTLISSA